MTGSGSEYIITIANCLDGHLAGLVLNTAAVVDAAGNIGPTLANQTTTTKIDTTAPIVHFFDVTEPGTAATPTWVFDSEEPVTGMIASNFSFSGTAQSCSMNYQVLRAGLGWQIALTNCSVGTTQVTLAANTVTDSAGNTGPLVALASNVETITPDEIVNQSITPTLPTGSNVEGLSPREELLEPEARVIEPKPETKSSEIIQLPVSKKVETKVKEQAVITETQQQSFLVALGLSAAALLLASIAASSQMRSRRRKH
jgi:hypothetical protein